MRPVTIPTQISLFDRTFNKSVCQFPRESVTLSDFHNKLPVTALTEMTPVKIAIKKAKHYIYFNSFIILRCMLMGRVSVLSLCYVSTQSISYKIVYINYLRFDIIYREMSENLEVCTV